MTKEELIELLRGNLWAANDQCIEGVDRAAEKIAIKFFLMEAEIERLTPDRMGGQFTERDTWMR